MSSAAKWRMILRMRALRLLLKVTGGLFLVAVLGYGGLAAFGLATEYTPAPVEDVAVECSGQPVSIRAGDELSAISWNIQFSAGRKHKFFYEGGDVSHVPESDVTATLAAINQAIQSEQADLLLLQEVDRASARTHDIDQAKGIFEGTAMACRSDTPYFKVAWVPKPFHEPLGHMDMVLSLQSRALLRNAVRTQLALLDERREIQAFNLKRALFTAELPVEGMDQPLAVAVTHLSAFSKGDGTLGKQVAALRDWMASRPADQPWILAGDLNMLPPGDDPSRFGAEASDYADDPNPMTELIPRFKEAFGDDQLAESARTWVKLGSGIPDKRIDYFFYGGPIEVLSAAALRQYAALSDHLPLSVKLRVGNAPPQEEAAAPEGAAAVDEAPAD